MKYDKYDNTCVYTKATITIKVSPFGNGLHTKGFIPYNDPIERAHLSHIFHDLNQRGPLAEWKLSKPKPR